MMKYLLNLFLVLITVVESYTLMSTCMPTDYKGVIARDQIHSMTFAMDYESDLRRTTYLVGGHSQFSTTRVISTLSGSRTFQEITTIEGFMYTFVQSGSECEVQH